MTHKGHRIHPSLASLLIVVSALVLVGICVYIGVVPVKRAGVTTRQTVPVRPLVTNFTVDYPVFHLPRIDAVLAESIQDDVDAFQAKLGGKRNDLRNHLTITYQLFHHGSRTVSIMLTKKEQVVGLPPQESRRFMTLDLKEQRQLLFNDLLKPEVDYRSFISKLLHDYFKQEVARQFSPPELVKLLELQPDDLQEFSLGDDEVIVYINPRSPASREGRLPVAVKKQLLAPLLRDVYATEDTATSQTHPVEPSFVVALRPLPGDTINPAAPMLALTFDDGPSSFTPGLLDALNKYEAHATFFVLGYSVQEHANTVRRAVGEGNEIGNHSWSHVDLRHQYPAELERQIGDTQRAVQRVTGGYVPTRMRPPRGETNAVVRQFAQGQNLTETLWNVDTKDWRDRDVQVVYDRIMQGAADGQVILLHDIHSTSVEAAIRSIPALKAKGFQLVTVSQLDHHR